MEMEEKSDWSVDIFADKNQEIANLKLYIEILTEYNDLLSEELNETVSQAAIHGWRSTRFQKGEDLRNQLKVLKESINL